jgi:hypothetical protein
VDRDGEWDAWCAAASVCRPRWSDDGIRADIEAAIIKVEAAAAARERARVGEIERIAGDAVEPTAARNAVLEERLWRLEDGFETLRAWINSRWGAMRRRRGRAPAKRQALAARLRADFAARAEAKSGTAKVDAARVRALGEATAEEIERRPTKFAALYGVSWKLLRAAAREIGAHP